MGETKASKRKRQPLRTKFQGKEKNKYGFWQLATKYDCQKIP